MATAKGVGMVTLTVRYDGQRLTLTVPKTAYVNDVIQKAAEALKEQSDGLQVLYQGTQLPDDARVQVNHENLTIGRPIRSGLYSLAGSDQFRFNLGVALLAWGPSVTCVFLVITAPETLEPSRSPVSVVALIVSQVSPLCSRLTCGSSLC